MYHFNYDLESVVTPINVDVYERLLRESKYPTEEIEFLVKGFREGFSLGYQGPQDRQDTAANIPLNVGSPTILWNKMMKEVKHGRFAGPYCDPPFANYIQSPVGLVPKAGNQTRLIFHLSFDFKGNWGSVNLNTPDDICSVQYRDLDYAVTTCIELLRREGCEIIFYSKSDLQSAFRTVPLGFSSYKWLLMKVQEPRTKKYFFFTDKCLPFGASISCALFSQFSDSLHHLIEYQTQKRFIVTNYLDDFLFVAGSEEASNALVRGFLSLCREINCPVSMEKTEWASDTVIFLGILLDGRRHCLCIPDDKKLKAINQLNLILSKKNATIKEVQSLTGLLNFLGKAIVPGRAFTRRMYPKLKTTNRLGVELKSYHHVRITEEFKSDCNMWLLFLTHSHVSQLCRPFLDLKTYQCPRNLNFYSDSSGKIGLGCYFQN